MSLFFVHRKSTNKARDREVGGQNLEDGGQGIARHAGGWELAKHLASNGLGLEQAMDQETWLVP